MPDLPPEYEVKAQAELLSTASHYLPSASQSSSSNCISRAHIVALKHCNPGRISKRGKVLTGRLIEEIAEPIILPTDVSFEGLVDILIQRVERRFETYLYRTGADRSAVVLRADGVPVNVTDEVSWVAARCVLERELKTGGDVKLEFYFARVPPGWTGPKKKFAKCVVM